MTLDWIYRCIIHIRSCLTCHHSRNGLSRHTTTRYLQSTLPTRQKSIDVTQDVKYKLISFLKTDERQQRKCWSKFALRPRTLQKGATWFSIANCSSWKFHKQAHTIAASQSRCLPFVAIPYTTLPCNSKLNMMQTQKKTRVPWLGQANTKKNKSRSSYSHGPGETIQSWE